MKKEYISPVVFQTIIHAENLMSGSVTGVGGNSGITKGDDSEAPTEGDARKRNDFDDDELLDEELIQETSGWKGGLW